ncbi:MAG: isoprenyl transferase [Flammeovirgaceae bacterium]|nr:isoprenyl transferase [Flammeovirgaceae bacterium]MDW8287119.1 isoprenyl transferase [Flammeovirgaceae bacterium]
MKEKIDMEKVPQHIAVIMDGNGRWAKKRGAKRVFGHQNAIQAVRETVEAAAELGVKHLTLYAFSTENWNRPESEVAALMKLLVSTIRSETPTLVKHNIRLTVIGNLTDLPDECQQELNEAIHLTRQHTGMNLIIALSYSGRWEITRAVNILLEKARNGTLPQSTLTEADFSNYLTTKGVPDPELLIRTSGEQRISNFLLWQIAYTELFFTDTLWPDFRKEDVFKAVWAYQQRERRFGKTSEQLIGQEE